MGKTTIRVGCVALVDIVAQTINYAGSTMAGPTIFAIVYSSVTVWCALLSRVVLGRTMTRSQWASVAVVFAGLGATGLRSLELGPNVVRGTILVGFGSALHALMYVLSEAVMNGGRDGCHGGDNNADNDGEKEEEKPLSARR